MRRWRCLFAVLIAVFLLVSMVPAGYCCYSFKILKFYDCNDDGRFTPDSGDLLARSCKDEWPFIAREEWTFSIQGSAGEDFGFDQVSEDKRIQFCGTPLKPDVPYIIVENEPSVGWNGWTCTTGEVLMSLDRCEFAEGSPDITVGCVNVFFVGNSICFDADPRTPGYWQNPKREADFMACSPDIHACCLWGADGLVSPDFGSFDEFRSWLKAGNAKDMANQLSRHLAAMILNCESGKVSAFNTLSLPEGSQQFVGTTMQQAKNALCALCDDVDSNDPSRDELERLKDILDQANNGDPEVFAASLGLNESGSGGGCSIGFSAAGMLLLAAPLLTLLRKR